MIRQSQITKYFFFGVVTWCLFSVKIVLAGVGDGGVRIDDILILMAFLVLLARGDFLHRPLSRAMRYYLAFAGIGLFSACWNGLVGRVPIFVSLVWAARVIEYLVFYYIGFYLAERQMDIGRLLTVYLWVMAAVVPLQMIGIVPIVSAFSIERAIGNTNGPYELAAVASFTLCFLGYGRKSKSAGAISGILIFLTASRVTAIAALLSFVKVRFTRATNRKGVVTVVLTVAAGLAMFFSLTYAAKHTEIPGLGLFNRLENSESITSWNQVAAIWDDAPYYQTAEQFAAEGYNDLEDVNVFGGDESGLMRFRHWIILIKNTIRHPDSLLIGLGPSFGTIAVDGYFVRVFIETGLFGLIAFCSSIGVLLLERRRSDWAFREFVFIMVLTGTLIDIFSSYHPMVLLWLWHGMNQVTDRGRKKPLLSPKQKAERAVRSPRIATGTAF
jgi:hypothetical protein